MTNPLPILLALRETVTLWEYLANHPSIELKRDAITTIRKTHPEFMPPSDLCEPYTHDCPACEYSYARARTSTDMCLHCPVWNGEKFACEDVNIGGEFCRWNHTLQSAFATRHDAARAIAARARENLQLLESLLALDPTFEENWS